MFIYRPLKNKKLYKMLVLQTLLILSALVALGAGIPQMIKLIKTKNSDEFNLGTWTMWIATQSVSTAYAISIGDVLLMSINAAWVLFYLTMSVLIIKYSPQRITKKAVLVQQEVQVEV